MYIYVHVLLIQHLCTCKFMCIQPFIAQYVASKMLFVDFIWFPEQPPTVLGDADVIFSFKEELEL